MLVFGPNRASFDPTEVLTSKMKYYIPEWDDRVDPDYNFVTDQHSEGHTRNPYSDEYMWEIFAKDRLPFDGILVSRAKLEQNKKKLAEVKHSGVRGFLRLPDGIPLLADCGAWSYIEEDIPPYDPIEILDFYSSIGVNTAVTVDHLIVPKFEHKRQQRFKITFENGVKGYDAWKEKYQENFDLLVSVQGWDADDYLGMIQEYNHHGIQRFALGGLARTPTSELITLIDRLESGLRTRLIRAGAIHFFGLGRFALLGRFARLEDLGVEVSFDTASWLRRAWLSGTNYYYVNDRLEGYSAIRVPQPSGQRTGLRGKKRLATTVNIDNAASLQDKCLSSIRKYALGEMDLQSVMKSILEYGKVVPTVRPEMKAEYERTLNARPWKECNCEICRKAGVEVLIFRGNNRNRRRGFHNVYTIYHRVIKRPELWPNISEEPTKLNRQQLAQLSGQVLVIVECSKRKVGRTRHTKIAAKKLYQGPLFKAARRYAELKKFDYAIISAKHGLLFPNEIVEGYDELLKTKRDVEEIRDRVESRLVPILPKYDRVLFIGGEMYTEVLRNIWTSRFVTLKSRGYADMTSMLIKSTPRTGPTLMQFLGNAYA